MMGFLHKNNSWLDASVVMNNTHKAKVKTFTPNRVVFLFLRLSIGKPEKPFPDVKMQVPNTIKEIITNRVVGQGYNSLPYVVNRHG